MNRHATRGGSWRGNQRYACYASRFRALPENFGVSQGFRLVRLLQEDSQRVLRGGSWCSGPEALRSAFRYGFNPNGANNYFGFRLIRKGHE